MKDDKSEKISISMPGSLLVALDDYLEGRGRSDLLQELIQERLKSEGALPDTASARLRDILRNVPSEGVPVLIEMVELLSVSGPEAARAKLSEWKAEHALAGGAA